MFVYGKYKYGKVLHFIDKVENEEELLNLIENNYYHCYFIIE